MLETLQRHGESEGRAVSPEMRRAIEQSKEALKATARTDGRKLKARVKTTVQGVKNSK